MIDLHYWPTPNGHKITIALEEMELPYTIHRVDIGKGDQFKPDFLKIAPNNRMPAIVDDGFVDTVARHFGEAARLSAQLGPLAGAPGDLAERALRWVGEAARRAEQAAAQKLLDRIGR